MRKIDKIEGTESFVLIHCFLRDLFAKKKLAGPTRTLKNARAKHPKIEFLRLGREVQNTIINVLMNASASFRKVTC